MNDAELPDSWRLASLSELGEVNRGRSRHRPRYAEHLYGGPYPFIQTGDIRTSGGRITSHSTTYSEAGLAQSRLWPAGTMCITIAANIAETAILTYPACFPDSVVGFIADPARADVRFVEYAFRLLKRRLQQEAMGSVQDNINLEVLGRLRLPLPDLGEQRAIAGVLSSLDDKIEQNRRTAAKLEALARATFRAWFVDFAPVHAKAAGATTYPGLPPAAFAALPATFADSPLGPIPQGWEVKPLDEACTINPTLPLKKGQVAPYLDMKNMPTQGHRPDEIIDRPFGSGMRFQNGDTLVARITPCLENGKTAFVDFLEDGAVGWGSTEYIVIRPRPPLPPIYGYCLARTPEFREFAIQNMSGTSGRQRVPPAAMSHYTVAVPPEPIARAFGETAGPLFDLIRANDEESRHLAALRDYLLPGLLSGRVRLSESDGLTVNSARSGI